jgi:hypothetical protein
VPILPCDNCLPRLSEVKRDSTYHPNLLADEPEVSDIASTEDSTPLNALKAEEDLVDRTSNEELEELDEIKFLTHCNNKKLN